MLDGASGRIRLSEQAVAAHPALKAHVGRTIAVGIRPENIHDPAERTDHPEDQRLSGTVELCEALGSDLVVHFSVPGTKVDVEDVREGTTDETTVALAGSGSVPVVARFGPRSKVALGEVVPIAVDTERMHFFDMSTRNAIWT